MLERLKKWDINLNIIIGSFVGVFIGHCIYRYFDYRSHPELYETWSAPWYTSIQIYGLITGLIVFIAFIIKFLIKKKLKNN